MEMGHKYQKKKKKKTNQLLLSTLDFLSLKSLQLPHTHPAFYSNLCSPWVKHLERKGVVVGIV